MFEVDLHVPCLASFLDNTLTQKGQWLGQGNKTFYHNKTKLQINNNKISVRSLNN